MRSRATVALPFHKRIVFVCFLNCPEFSGRFSKISQAHNPISGIQFHASGGGALRAVASWRGLSQEPPRRATAEAE
jgi:hypothetical protein